MQTPTLESETPLVALPARMRGLQKLADAADWNDARLDRVVRDVLGLEPAPNPRQWEFAMVYLGLASAGMLEHGRRGISFGSGREPLIFHIAGAAGHVTATDLYDSDTRWMNAQSSDPQAYVMARAPQGFDGSRLSVQRMDMRDASAVPDDSMDFAWSVSAFEHIGGDEDFLRHFSEVRRILRPDGLYVMTTEVRVGSGSSFLWRGNSALTLPYLLDLFRRAGLQAEPRFDARLDRLKLNEARDLGRAYHQDASFRLRQLLVVRERAGIFSVPGLFLLRPLPAGAAATEVAVDGLEESGRWLVERNARLVRQRFSAWTQINPHGAGNEVGNAHVDLFAAEGMRRTANGNVVATAYLWFGAGPVEMRLTLVGAAEAPAKGELEVQLLAMAIEGEPRISAVLRTRVAFDGTPDAVRRIPLCFQARDDAAYCVLARTQDEGMLFSVIDLVARHAARGALDGEEAPPPARRPRRPRPAATQPG